MSEEKPFDCLKSEAEEATAELEGQFILRLPLPAATSLRHSLQSGALNLQKRLKIHVGEDKRHCEVVYDGWSLSGKVMDVPTVVECFKTLDRKIFYKTADICQILVCDDGDMRESFEQPLLDKDKMFSLPHGVTAPLKNVRRHRFRKTLKKKKAEMYDHNREVKFLFRQDAEAISVRYELVSAEEDKQQIKNESNDLPTENGVDASQILEVDEADLFGELSCSSGESEEDEEEVVNLGEELVNDGIPINVMNGQYCQAEPVKSGLECLGTTENSGDIMEEENASVLQLESEAAGENLGLLLQEQMMEDEKLELSEKFNELGCRISYLQSKQRDLELEILVIENEALRERFQLNIDQLKREICEKQTEYNGIMTVLQEN